MKAEFDRLDVSARWRAIHAVKPPTQIGLPPKPIRYALDYGPGPGELAVELALIRGVLRLHPNFHDQHAFVNMLTPIQQAVYARSR